MPTEKAKITKEEKYNGLYAVCKTSKKLLYYLWALYIFFSTFKFLVMTPLLYKCKTKKRYEIIRSDPITLIFFYLLFCLLPPLNDQQDNQCSADSQHRQQRRIRNRAVCRLWKNSQGNQHVFYRLEDGIGS